MTLTTSRMNSNPPKPSHSLCRRLIMEADYGLVFSPRCSRTGAREQCNRHRARKLPFDGANSLDDAFDVQILNGAEGHQIAWGISWGRGDKIRGEIAHAQTIAFAQQDGPLNDIAQLAGIARPTVT